MTLTASIDKTKSITLKTDIGFKYVFKIKDNLKALLEDILNLNITSLDYLDSNLDKITKLGKDSRLDILVKLNNEFIVNIEMQQNKCHMLPRQLFYLAKIISKELNVNDDYQKLKKYIMISIQDYQEKEDYDKEVQNSYLLVKNKQQPIDIIRFEKLNLKSKKINNPKLKGWIKLFKEEGIIEMKKYESEEEKIQKVAKLLKKLNADPEALILYEAEEKRIRDKVAYGNYQYEEGITKGINETKKASAINLFKNGVSKELICKSLELPMSELNSILIN